MVQAGQGLRFSLYLDPKSMSNNGIYGCYYGFRAIILHTFGVWVRFRVQGLGFKGLGFWV